MTFALISVLLVSCFLSVAVVLGTPKTKKEQMEEDDIQIQYVAAWRDRKQKRTDAR